jgi:hypothetical protein
LAPLPVISNRSIITPPLKRSSYIFRPREEALPATY